jgi:hypothetical protein
MSCFCPRWQTVARGSATNVPPSRFCDSATKRHQVPLGGNPPCHRLPPSATKAKTPLCHHATKGLKTLGAVAGPPVVAAAERAHTQE